MIRQADREVARTRLKQMKEVEHTRHTEKNMVMVDKRDSMMCNKAGNNKNKKRQISRAEVGP